MNLENLVDAAKLQEHLDAGVVNVQHHGELPLTIFNYSQRAQFDHIWDDVTCLCRGLIVDEQDEVVARPFKKFFNLNHNGRPETQITALPPTQPEVTEKLDGSLGILYEYDGHRAIATRGSFASEQAKFATKWYLQNLSEAIWPEGYTPMFEIIYSDNRIVVRYEWEGLSLLSLVNNETGREMSHAEVKQWADENGCRCVPLYEKSIDECAAHKQSNFEGFVLTWHDPYLKVKVKLDEYQKLHRIVTGFSPIALWEHIRYGWPYEDIKANLADCTDFIKWIEFYERMFKENYSRVEAGMEKIWAGRPTALPDDPKVARKEIAGYFCKHPAFAGMLFAKLDGKDYSDMIWKDMRPHGAHPWKQVDE